MAIGKRIGTLVVAALQGITSRLACTLDQSLVAITDEAIGNDVGVVVDLHEVLVDGVDALVIARAHAILVGVEKFAASVSGPALRLLQECDPSKDYDKKDNKGQCY